MTTRFRLQRTQIIPRPRSEVFGFFADAANLEALTPKFLNFQILTPLPIAMYEGARIEYRLRLLGLPVHWLTEITAWERDERFVDQQLAGPYRYWHHTHTFSDAGPGTEMHDQVEYELPFGPLGNLTHALLVRKLLTRIFDYREEAVRHLLGSATLAA